jgi:ADP-ribose pyrophosphatase YjhB (NUDIX family)
MGCRQACHVAVWAQVDYKLWGQLPAGHAILMQMRFDGLLGFPGGLVDKVEGALEDLATAANRELAEELSTNVRVNDDDYLGCIYLPDEAICTHLFEKRVSAAVLDELERDALSAHDRFEVCGTLRCPCYALPARANGGVSNKGFGLFIQQRFAGNAKQQLLRLVRDRDLVSKDVFEEAVAMADVRHLLV